METNVSASLCNGQSSSCDEHASFTPLGKRQFDGVSPRNVYTTTVTESDDKFAWFLMRVAYGQEQKVANFLKTQNIEYFLPLKIRKRVLNGKTYSSQTSLIPNFLFVKSTEHILKQYVGKAPLTYFHHYYVPIFSLKRKMAKTGVKPLIIPDSQMELFRRWYVVDDENKYYVCDDDFKFKTNDKVRVTKGNFMGFVGNVCRIKGQSRVGVTIKGVGTIFTAYIPKMWLERIEK